MSDPDGQFVDFIITYEGGETKIIVENGPTIKCGDVPTNAVIKKLLTENVPGFGLNEVIDHGHTEEYFKQKAIQLQITQEEKNQPLIQRREEREEKKQQFDV